MPASGASLRCVRGRDLLDPARSLVLQPRGEQPPTTLANATVKASFSGNSNTGLQCSAARRAGHRPHVEGFDTDRVEAARNCGGGFFDPVPTSVGLPCLEFGDRALCAGTPVGATLRTGQALLKHPQPLRLTSGCSGCVQKFTGRQRRRHGNAAVDTYHCAVVRPGDRIGHVGERQMPAAGPITSDPVGLDPVRYRTRETKAHPSDLGHPYPTEPTVDPLDVMRFHCDLPKALVHTGFAPRRAPMRSGKEVAHRLGEVPQRLLLHRLTSGTQPRVLGAGIRQLSALFVVARRFAARLPVLLLLDRHIPHIPGMATMLG